MADVDIEGELLTALRTHGEQFLQSFGLPKSRDKRKRATRDKFTVTKISKVERDDEEWHGIVYSSSDQKSLSEKSNSEFEQNDGEHIPTGNVIVFSDIPTKINRQLDSKAQMNAFMSSKVSKLRHDQPEIEKQFKSEVDQEDEKTNAQNDALLHKLVHTKLLSGSLDPNFNLTPAKRRKALAGRVLELAGAAKLGKGEKSVRQVETNKAAKRVREGIVSKQKERQKKELEEAKNLGNYHPTLKRVYEGRLPTTNRSRTRGLKMGVGKFSGGLLRLSKDEIDIVQGNRRASNRGHGSSRTRNGSRSRGRDHNY